MLWWIGFIVTLVALAAACASSDQTAGPQPSAPPDLTPLVSRLTSSDPDVQELALAPGVRVKPGETVGVLPAGSTLVLKPGTWEVTGVDQADAPYLGRIQASLARSDQPAKNVNLHLVRIGDQWLLYETNPV